MKNNCFAEVVLPEEKEYKCLRQDIDDWEKKFNLNLSRESYGALLVLVSRRERWARKQVYRSCK